MSATTAPAHQHDPSKRDFEREVIPLMSALHHVAMRLTRDPVDADDLVQDSMVRAFRFWSTFRNGSNLKAWMFTILRNTFINEYHRSRRRRTFEGNVTSDVHAHGSAAAVAFSSSEPEGPEEMLSKEQTRLRIRDALESIPENYSIAVELADLDGCAYDEIADLMECSIGTVMSRVFRGREALHAVLHEHALETGMISADVVPGQRVTSRTRPRQGAGQAPSQPAEETSIEERCMPIRRRRSGPGRYPVTTADIAVDHVESCRVLRVPAGEARVEQLELAVG